MNIMNGSCMNVDRILCIMFKNISVFFFGYCKYICFDFLLMVVAAVFLLYESLHFLHFYGNEVKNLHLIWAMLLMILFAESQYRIRWSN